LLNLYAECGRVYADAQSQATESHGR
jgi:hypothetical protein